MKTKSFAALCLLAFATHLLAAPDYEIRFERPPKVGQRFHVAVTAHELSDTAVTADGTNVKNDHKEFDIDFVAEAKILALGTNGRAIKQSFTVDKLVKDTGGERKSILDQGQVFIASKDGKKSSFTVNGEPVGKDVAEILSIIVDTNTGNSPDEDAMFGTRERKKVGDSWKVNAAKLAESVGLESDMNFKNLSGEFTLREVAKDGDTDVLVITGDITGAFQIPLPAGLAVKESHVDLAITGHYPVDVSLGIPQNRVAMEFVVDARGRTDPAGPEIQLKLTAKRTLDMHRTLLK